MTSAQTDPTIASLAERLLRLLLASEPLDASLLGFREYDAALADLSAAHEREQATVRSGIRDEALAVDTAALDEPDALTRAVIIAQTRYSDLAAAAELPEFTVAAFPVSPSSILIAYLRMVVVTDEQQAADYLARLGEIPRYLAQSLERLAAGREKGLTPVAHLVEMAVSQIDRFLAADPSPLAVAAPDDWSAAEAWRADVAAAIDEVVNPAFRAYRDALVADVLPSGRDAVQVGLVHLPGGLERYRGLVEVHTTTLRTPEELHAIGLDLVAGVHAEFRELGERLFGLSDVPGIFAHLQEDPSLRWTSEQEILDAAETAVRRAEAASADWFGTLPTAVCALEAIPELEAEGAPPAYYMPPALDGSRPGTYYTNVSQPGERTSFDLESVAFHEAVPGHHFQISLSLEVPGLPMIRRLSLFTAYVEGWGLYSERLADEMGLYSSDLQRMGMLSADAWRAARLVVDTGLHAFGWSRQQAVDYLLENTPVAPIDVEAEIDRYIAYPGQALSYMTGRLEIQRLRAVAEAELAGDFDIKEFHDAMMLAGALPLEVLADAVTAWIVSQRA